MYDGSTYVADAHRTEAPVTPELTVRLIGAARLIHAVFGLTTEVGEFTDQLKRHIFYGKQLDYVNLEEEIGDLFWYVALALHVMGVPDFFGIMERNINKLKARFPEKFAEFEALNRDLDRERKTLENAMVPPEAIQSRNVPLDGENGLGLVEEEEEIEFFEKEKHQMRKEKKGIKNCSFEAFSPNLVHITFYFDFDEHEQFLIFDKIRKETFDKECYKELHEKMEQHRSIYIESLPPLKSNAQT